jgi:hypothetical protein
MALPDTNTVNTIGQQVLNMILQLWPIVIFIVGHWHGVKTTQQAQLKATKELNTKVTS